MRVGILTSHRVPCGVAEYSNRLADALARQPDTEVVILAGRADEHRSVPEESKQEVHDVAGIGLWRDDGRYWLDVDLGHLRLDVIHVQYQSMLFTQPDLEALASTFGGLLAITYHDNCQRPDFPVVLFDLHFTHRWNVGPGCPDVIPFGIEDRPPVIRTFGLGRTRTDLIAPICQRHGWILQDSSSHEPIQGGGHSWKSHEELIGWLRGADAIVLWYDEQSMAGSSQAVRTALAARRPVVTNDTKWFEDLPRHMLPGDYYLKVQGLEDLERVLLAKFERPYVVENSWDKVAALLRSRYAAAREQHAPPEVRV